MENIMKITAKRKRLAEIETILSKSKIGDPSLNNRNGGYLTRNDSILLKDNHHAFQQSLDVINKLNSIKFSLDENVLAEPEERDSLDTPEKIQQFEQFCNESITVYDYILEEGNEYYMTHSLDFRGRCYVNGYTISYQSGEYRKALTNLAKKTLITK